MNGPWNTGELPIRSIRLEGVESAGWLIYNAVVVMPERDLPPRSSRPLARGNSARQFPAVIRSTLGFGEQVVGTSQLALSCDVMAVRSDVGGGLAQLGEHDVRNVGVGGSNPLPSTTIVGTCLSG